MRRQLFREGSRRLRVDRENCGDGGLGAEVFVGRAMGMEIVLGHGVGV